MTIGLSRTVSVTEKSTLIIRANIIDGNISMVRYDGTIETEVDIYYSLINTDHA